MAMMTPQMSGARKGQTICKERQEPSAAPGFSASPQGVRGKASPRQPDPMLPVRHFAWPPRPPFFSLLMPATGPGLTPEGLSSSARASAEETTACKTLVLLVEAQAGGVDFRLKLGMKGSHA